jgi:hypothetical protein
MDNGQVLYQSPRPEVVIYSPEGDEKFRFDTSHRTSLQGYTFGTSINDPKGRFSLSLFPDDQVIFDEISPMDIIEIYESRNHFKQFYSGSEMVKQITPTFTGVVRSKKYGSQITEGRSSRRINIAGHSIAGLVQDFVVNLDLTAAVIMKSKAIIEDFVINMTKKFMSGESLELKNIVQRIWEYYLEFSKNSEEMATPKIAEYLERWAGKDMFNIPDTMPFIFSLGAAILGQNSQNFYDLIDGLLPSPVYEKFVYTDYKTGRMRIMIRECPFDIPVWEKLESREIDVITVKSFDLSLSDKEVYTVFFSYVDGYPEEMDKVIRRTYADMKVSSSITVDERKYGIYGYRPLQARFIGYGRKSGTEDRTTNENILKMNTRMRNWYGKIDEMYTGTINMATDLSKDMPNPGEKVQFLNGEFYVVDVEHRWNYGGNPETAISVSRGGNYESGEFRKMTNVTKAIIGNMRQPLAGKR